MPPLTILFAIIPFLTIFATIFAKLVTKDIKTMPMLHYNFLKTTPDDLYSLI